MQDFLTQRRGDAEKKKKIRKPLRLCASASDFGGKMARRIRVDMMIALLLAVGALILAVMSNRAPPAPAPMEAERIPTSTPTATATPGWWAEVTPGAYRPGPMPTLRAAGRRRGSR